MIYVGANQKLRTKQGDRHTSIKAQSFTQTCLTQKHSKYEQLKHCIVQSKTNQDVVLQTLSTTFQFLSAFLILAGGGSLIVAL